MPLPDERPRQSVANLIGRFEQQSKRQSIGSAPPLLAKQLTGASNASAGEPNHKEANKEKPVVAVAKDLNKPDANKTPTVPNNGSIDKPMPSPVSPISSPPKGPSVIESTKAISPRPSKSVASPPSSFSSPAIKRAVTHENTAGATPIKSALRRPPSSASNVPPSVFKPPTYVLKPLKPQHSGQSTTSTASTVRAKPPLTKAVPSTPSRPKTPAARPKTPATNPKTVSRPKTPSSGLYAPTAASLAKAKSASPSTSTPVKKTISATAASVSERLSKPTAASASKAKAPVAVAPSSPARGTKPPVRGVPPPKALLKPRVGLAGARLKQDKGSRPVGAAITNIVSSQAAENGTSGVAHHDPNEAATHEADIESYDSDFVDESFRVTPQPQPHDMVTEPITISDEVKADESVDVIPDAPTPEEVHVSAEHVAEPSEEIPQAEEAEEEVEVEALSSTGPELVVNLSTVEPEAHEDDDASKDEIITESPHTEETKPEEPVVVPPAPEEANTPDSGPGIEEMVNMLELRPPMPSRPVSMSSFPGDDAAGSIPDEE